MLISHDFNMKNGPLIYIYIYIYIYINVIININLIININIMLIKKNWDFSKKTHEIMGILHGVIIAMAGWEIPELAMAMAEQENYGESSNSVGKFQPCLIMFDSHRGFCEMVPKKKNRHIRKPRKTFSGCSWRTTKLRIDPNLDLTKKNFRFQWCQPSN